MSAAHIRGLNCSINDSPGCGYAFAWGFYYTARFAGSLNHGVSVEDRVSTADPHVIQQALFVAPLFFHLHKQFEVHSMAQHVFDVCACINANFF